MVFVKMVTIGRSSDVVLNVPVVQHPPKQADWSIIRDASVRRIVKFMSIGILMSARLARMDTYGTGSLIVCPVQLAKFGAIAMATWNSKGLVV